MKELERVKEVVESGGAITFSTDPSNHHNSAKHPPTLEQAVEMAGVGASYQVWGCLERAFMTKGIPCSVREWSRTARNAERILRLLDEAIALRTADERALLESHKTISPNSIVSRTDVTVKVCYDRTDKENDYGQP